MTWIRVIGSGVIKGQFLETRLEGLLLSMMTPVQVVHVFLEGGLGASTGSNVIHAGGPTPTRTVIVGIGIGWWVV